VLALALVMTSSTKTLDAAGAKRSSHPRGLRFYRRAVSRLCRSNSLFASMCVVQEHELCGQAHFPAFSATRDYSYKICDKRLKLAIDTQ
jgi:hypothetical protein